MSAIANLAFSIDGEGFTNIARDIFRDGRSAAALDLLLEGLQGITLDQAFTVLTGNQKLINAPDGSGLGLEEDATELDFSAYEDKPPRDLHGLLLRLKWFEEREETFRRLDEFKVLIHRACGRPMHRSSVAGRSSNYGSPVGIVTAQAACEYISQFLSEPTDEEWDKFWEEHTQSYDTHLGERNRFYEAHPEEERDDDGKLMLHVTGPTGPAKPAKGMREAALSGDVGAFIDAQLALDRKPCPEPDPDMAARDGWLLPTGKYYPCGYMEHPWLAGKLIADVANPERRGWIKIHASGVMTGLDTGLCVSPPQRGDGDAEPTAAQVDAIFKWCDRHHQELPHWMAPEFAREFHPAPGWKPTPRRQDMTGD